MSSAMDPACIKRNAAGEPLMLDLHVAEVVRLAQPLNIRRTIRKHLGSLGEVFTLELKPGKSGGRPSVEYHLTEAQAHKILAKCRTVGALEHLGRLAAIYSAARSGNGPAAVAMAQGTALQLAEPRGDMALLIKEMAAGREIQVATLAFLTKLADRLITPTPALPAPVKVLPARTSATVEPFVTAAKLAAQLGIPKSSFASWIGYRNDLRTLQRADGKWPLGPTMDAWHRRGDRAAELESRRQTASDPVVIRAGIVGWVQAYHRALRLNSEQIADLWHQIYGHFQVAMGYDPRALAGNGKLAIDIVQERGDLAALDRSVLVICPASRSFSAHVGHA